MARPREAHEESTTPLTFNLNRAEGVQRGWQSMRGILTPPLALFASFSGARKKSNWKDKLEENQQSCPSSPLDNPLPSCYNSPH